MAELLINASGLTEEEKQKVLTTVRNLRRKRWLIGAEELKYQADINGKKTVSRQQN